MKMGQNRLLDNISFLLKKYDMKNYELEEKLGVSRGYLSRMGRQISGNDFTTSFVVNLSSIFNISIDTLLFVDLSQQDEDELYIISFIDNLKQKTESSAYIWKRYDPRMIKDIMDGKTYAAFPMLDVHPDCQDDYDSYPHIHPKVYTSDCSGRYFLQEEMDLSGRAWFKLEIGNNELFVTGFLLVGEKNEEVLEMYIRSKKESSCVVDEEGYIDPASIDFSENGPEYTTSLLCSTLIADDDLRLKIEDLYKTIYSTKQNIKISDDARNAIKDILSQ